MILEGCSELLLACERVGSIHLTDIQKKKSNEIDAFSYVDKYHLVMNFAKNNPECYLVKKDMVEIYINI